MPNDLVKIAKLALSDMQGRLDATKLQVLEKCVDRLDELEGKLERISEEWAGAVYGDLENGVTPLNAAFAADFYRKYPLVSSFGETLDRIIDGETDD